MAIWAWMQPVDKIWKVVSDVEKGTIHVYNEKSDLIMEKKGLSMESVSLIEKYFLEIVATRMTAARPGNAVAMNLKKPAADFNYMYA